MKRIIVVLIIGMFGCFMLSGCCTKTDATGVTTKNFLNCVNKAADHICNPPAAVMAIVEGAGGIIAQALNILVPGSSLYINASNAKAIVDTVQQTGCIATTDLAKLIAFLKSSDFAQLQTSVGLANMKKGAKQFPAPMNVQLLVDWAATKGVK